jgi:hypothetical protein
MMGADSVRIRISRDISLNGKSSARFLIITNRSPLPVSVGDFIVRYGSPCRVILAPGGFILIYPNMDVSAENREADPINARLQPDAPLLDLRMGYIYQAMGFWVTCDDERANSWRGFTSAEIYDP